MEPQSYPPGLSSRRDPFDTPPTEKASTSRALLLNEDEASKFLGFKNRTLQKWRCTGNGPKYVRAGGRTIRYRLDHLLEWVEERVRTSTSDDGDAR